MSDTPSKVKPIELGAINGYAYDGTNASVIEVLPGLHFNNTRVRACLLKPILKTMTCPDFTPIDCIYGWSPESKTTSATQYGTRLRSDT